MNHEKMKYFDEEERALIESIENGGDYVEAPQEEIDEIVAGVRAWEAQKYVLRMSDLQTLKKDLELKGANEAVIKALEDFMSDKTVLNP